MFSNIKSDQNIFSYHPGLFTQREAVPHLWTLTLNKHSLISPPQLFPVNPTGHWHWFGDTHQPPFSHGCLQIAIKYGLEIMVKNEFTTILSSYSKEFRNKSKSSLTLTISSISDEPIITNAFVLTRSSVFTLRIIVAQHSFFTIFFIISKCYIDRVFIISICIRSCRRC